MRSVDRTKMPRLSAAQKADSDTPSNGIVWGRAGHVECVSIVLGLFLQITKVAGHRIRIVSNV